MTLSICLLFIRRSSLLFYCLLLFPILQADAASEIRKKTLVVFGDSLSAAYGMDSGKGWVSLLANKLESTHPDCQVINTSISGETTAGGLNRLPAVLKTHQPDVLLLELGANDGLRGWPLTVTETNLANMIQLAQRQGTRVFLFEMRIPPNYGQLYSQQFQNLFLKVSKAYDTPFIPFFLNGVAGHPNLNQPDGIHPTEQAQPLILNNLWPSLAPALEACKR